MQPITGHFLFFFLIQVFFLSSAFGSSHKVRNLSSRDGLSDMLVNCIHEDVDGLVWIGTGVGVDVFDGIRLRQYRLVGDDGPQKRVTAIVGSLSEGLWAGNGDGLWRFDIEKEAFVRVHTHDLVGSVRAMSLSSGGTLFVGTTHGLYSIVGERSGEIRQYASVSVRDMCIDVSGTLWFTSDDGLHALLPNTQLVHYYGDMPEGGFTSLATSDGKVWLGTFHDGIYLLKTEDNTPKRTHFIGSSSRSSSPVSSLQAVGSDTLVVATDGDGVYLLNTSDNSVLQHYTQSAQGSYHLTSNSVYSALYSASGQLWAGLYQHGLDYTLFQSDRVHVHHTPFFNSEGMAVRALAIHGAQHLIGTRQGLWLIDKESQFVRSWDEKDLDAQMVFALRHWHGYYYIGTYGGGLRRLSPSGGVLTSVGRQLMIGSRIFSLTESSDGDLWIASESGAFCLSESVGRVRLRYSFTTANSGIPAGMVYHIFFDRLSRGWLCTSGGMALFDPQTETVRTDLFPASFPQHTVVRQVCQTGDGTLYFLPDKGDPFAIDEQWHPQPVPDLGNRDALFMTEDSVGNAYIGTTDGLFCYRGGIHKDAEGEMLDFTDGLPSSIFTLCQPQIDEDGTVWLGNSDGLVWLKPDSMYSTQPANRQVYISRFLADNAEVENGIKAFKERSISLPRGTSSLTIYLSDLSYSDPSCMRFEYKLDGVDAGWQPLSGVSECGWSRLHAGRYTLHIRIPNRPQSEYTMLIRVPHDKKTTLIVIIVILLVVIGVGVCLDIWRRQMRREAGVEKEDDRLLVPVNRPNGDKYKTASIPVSELKRLRKQLDRLMEDEKLYLQPELKLSDIANRLNTSPYTLSYLFSQYMNTSFYDYINHYRVETFKEHVRSGSSSLYTLETLATRCGYNSRASFFRNFKKATGMTPTEWIRTRD